MICRTCGIEKLILGIKDDMIKSVTNRLAYLLIMSNEDYSRIQNKEQGDIIVTQLLEALVSNHS